MENKENKKHDYSLAEVIKEFVNKHKLVDKSKEEEIFEHIAKENNISVETVKYIWSVQFNFVNKFLLKRSDVNKIVFNGLMKYETTYATYSRYFKRIVRNIDNAKSLQNEEYRKKYLNNLLPVFLNLKVLFEEKIKQIKKEYVTAHIRKELAEEGKVLPRSIIKNIDEEKAKKIIALQNKNFKKLKYTYDEVTRSLRRLEELIDSCK